MSSSSSSSSSSRLKRSDYSLDCVSLCKQLLGKLLVSEWCQSDNGQKVRLSGRIVETEAYLGSEDASAHSYRGRTARNAAMFMPPGTCYVYNIYGQYCCCNVSALGDGCAVLIRALEPVDGVETMEKLRDKDGKRKQRLKRYQLCNGPSKLCQSLCISKAAHDQVDMCDQAAGIWIEAETEASASAASAATISVVTSKRIGIDGAGAEAAAKLLRFYVRGCTSVSKRDTAAEAAADAAADAPPAKKRRR